MSGLLNLDSRFTFFVISNLVDQYFPLFTILLNKEGKISKPLQTLPSIFSSQGMFLCLLGKQLALEDKKP